jgi:hypothetical protein
MSTKLYILFSAVLVSITMVGLFMMTAKLQENNNTAVASDSRAASLPAKQSPTATTSKDTAQTLTILNLWYDLAADADTNGIQIAGNIDTAQKIGIHQDLFSVIKSGYKVQLPHHIGDNYLLKLGKIIKVSDTETKIFAELEDGDETYFSTISIIDNKMLAVLSTPKGDYDMKMVDGIGVVYKSTEADVSQVGSVIDQPGFLD